MERDKKWGKTNIATCLRQGTWEAGKDGNKFIDTVPPQLQVEINKRVVGARGKEAKRQATITIGERGKLGNGSTGCRHCGLGG